MAEFNTRTEAVEHEIYLMFLTHTWCTYGGLNFVLGDFPGDREAVNRASSLRMKVLHKNPKFAKTRDERARKTIKALFADPEFVAAQAERMRVRTADPAFAKAHLERLKVLCTNPEFIKMKSAEMKALWENPEFVKAEKERSRRKMRTLNANPEFARANRERAKIRFGDPSFIKINSSNRDRGRHVRWHVNRNISKPETCVQCQDALEKSNGF